MQLIIEVQEETINIVIQRLVCM